MDSKLYIKESKPYIAYSKNSKPLLMLSPNTCSDHFPLLISIEESFPRHPSPFLLAMWTLHDSFMDVVKESLSESCLILFHFIFFKKRK